VAVKLSGLAAGVGFGFVLSWAQLTDPAVIRDMLLLRDPHVFLVMGAAIGVAAVGCRLLRSTGMRALLTAEPIRWPVVPAESKHLVGSMLFGAGWSVAGTCPGPVAAMIGQGRPTGLLVGLGILIGVSLQPVMARSHTRESLRPERSGAAGL